MGENEWGVLLCGGVHLTELSLAVLWRLVQSSLKYFTCLSTNLQKVLISYFKAGG